MLYDKLDSIYQSGAKVVVSLSKRPIGDVATQFFADTIGRCRSLMVNSKLNHALCRDVRVQLLSWFQRFLLPKFMCFLIFSAENWHFYFDFALFLSVFSNFQSFLSVASDIPVYLVQIYVLCQLYFYLFITGCR